MNYFRCDSVGEATLRNKQKLRKNYTATCRILIEILSTFPPVHYVFKIEVELNH
jgi:hypothetical protein